MRTGVDPAETARSVEGLRSSDLASGELEASLRAVADATAHIFGADGGGVMLIDDQQALHYVGATDGRAAALEAAQQEMGEGPCVDSLIGNHVVQTPDLMEDTRWPALREAIGDLGVHAILGVPLHAGSSPVGSLNVYRFDRYEWSADDVAAMQAHASIIEELLANAMLAGRQSSIVYQLQTALENRVTIDRATGVVMALHDVDPSAAFQAMRLDARSRRLRIAEYAEQVVRTRKFPLPADLDLR